MKEEEEKNKIFKLVQDYLKSSPTIIWGSGATIPFGMPSMDDLKNDLNLSKNTENLEKILNEVSTKKLKEYEKKIFKIINKKDEKFRKKINENTFDYLNKLIKFFYQPSPRLINIITTNYDCILEYFLSYCSYPFSDGFSGREFSKFDGNNFKTKEHVNLLKVHGSLRWQNNRYSYYNKDMQAVYPSNEKYKKSSQEPFRTLIAKSDEIIKNSKSFLVIGFGFNDEHLTPKLEEAMKEGDIKIVIVTKKATENITKKIKTAKNIILIEEKKNNQTKFTYKENNETETEFFLEEDYWNLEKFTSILK